MKVAFYHLSISPLEVVLLQLLKKTLESQERAVVVSDTPERLELLSNVLWTAEPDSWIPHGSKMDGQPMSQPIWLTTMVENPNEANFLFLTDGMSVNGEEDFSRCFDLFDGKDQEAVVAAGHRWAALKHNRYERTYWRQENDGKWIKGEEIWS